KVLDTIGFDAAIDRAAKLLDISDPDQIRRTFPRVYPLGLGIISTSPLRMARAFAVFANQGRNVSPMAIRSVENRNGQLVLDPEREVRVRQQRMGDAFQVISPQNAYIMTSMLKKTVEMGTLYNPSGWGSKFTFKDANGKNFRMPMAGKTGTPQNWSDAWTVGYSPYYTTAIWFGFDRPGNSLGLSLTGSTLAGPVWADYMREIHQGLPFRDFVRPSSGLIDVTVCAKSGLLRTDACNEGELTLPFLEGTQPDRYCNIHGNAVYSSRDSINIMAASALTIDDGALVNSLPMPTLNLDFLSPPRPEEEPNRTGGDGVARTGASGNRNTRTGSGRFAPSRNGPAILEPPGLEFSGNPLLDGDEDTALAGEANAAREVPADNAPAGYGLELPDYNPLLD
ncbi:MAG: penicillin-binding protein, partial [Treponema sp.]|nr:penicillin-binding protein [Treponema sp.]